MKRADRGPGDRAGWRDGSNHRQALIGVVIPRSVQDVETTVRLAREHGAPVLSRGGGTGLAGQCCNVAMLPRDRGTIIQVGSALAFRKTHVPSKERRTD